jgi:hypothetical protein
MSKTVRFPRQIIAAIIVALVILTVPRGASGDYGSQPGRTQEKSGLFKFVGTVQVTPDATFLNGGFVRINYVSSTDRFAVVFGTRFAQPTGGCMGGGHAYKEYTLEMQETGQSGVLNCEGGDSGGVMAEDVYYDVSMHAEGESQGWRIITYDAVTWATLADLFFPLDSPREGNGDMMVAFVNGQLDVSSGYTSYGGPPPPEQGAETHHQFFSTDLEFQGKQILDDIPHIGGSALIEVDGIIYFITATAYTGDLIVMTYDENWQYLGMKELIKQAHWSTGVAYDGQRFYVAYLDTRQRTEPGFFPYTPNVHLAAFDQEWNLVDDVAVTRYGFQEAMTGRPWVLLHGNRLYVSYDAVLLDPVTHAENLDQIQGFVSIYELNSAFSPSLAQPTPTPSSAAQPEQPAGLASACSEEELSPLGVLRSTDQGATWTSLGNACLHGSSHLLSADPTPLMINGSIVLYFLDLKTLTNDPSTATQRIIYRATSVDGVNFDQVQPVYSQNRDVVDPFVLAMSDGTFRMYMASDPEGIISATSSDGLVFNREDGVRSRAGGMPGALLLPDGRVRLFLAGNGIASQISGDGLTFTPEDGLRIPGPANSIVDNPEPIRLADGSYLMLYQVHDRALEALPPWERDEIHLATSPDGFDWTTNPTIIGYGGTSCVVEAADGTLYLYYGH